jgi:hypothetical protein
MIAAVLEMMKMLTTLPTSLALAAKTSECSSVRSGVAYSTLCISPFNWYEMIEEATLLLTMHRSHYHYCLSLCLIIVVGHCREYGGVGG